MTEGKWELDSDRMQKYKKRPAENAKSNTLTRTNSVVFVLVMVEEEVESRNPQVRYASHTFGDTH